MGDCLRQCSPGVLELWPRYIRASSWATSKFTVRSKIHMLFTWCTGCQDFSQASWHMLLYPSAATKIVFSVDGWKIIVAEGDMSQGCLIWPCFCCHPILFSSVLLFVLFSALGPMHTLEVLTFTSVPVPLIHTKHFLPLLFLLMPLPLWSFKVQFKSHFFHEVFLTLLRSN